MTVAKLIECLNKLEGNVLIPVTDVDVRFKTNSGFINIPFFRFENNQLSNFLTAKEIKEYMEGYNCKYTNIESFSVEFIEADSDFLLTVKPYVSVTFMPNNKVGLE